MMFLRNLGKNMATNYKIIFLPRANENLTDIDNYLCQFYPNTAANFFSKLDSNISHLRANPYIGAKYVHNENYRRLPVGDYLVFYVVDDSRQTVEIHRVLHGSQDIAQQLRESANGQKSKPKRPTPQPARRFF